MFGKKLKKFYYGDGTEHVIELTQSEADSANNLRLEEVPGMEGYYSHHFEGPGNVKDYQSAAEKLNKYLETHGPVTWMNTDVGPLRPVK